ncbi:hypothetical protein GCM10022291_18060 [Postechiella marina]|uniref:Outer membrane protein beta-barrel domain-containing protein n=1 Tax=Postechiella marina TaxID=943941 RepID=A0ABP8C9D9_9FLAO
MSDKKHIDRLFQEKFKDFEKTPNDAVWANIEAKLNEKKKRRVIPIWWRYASVAALLLLLLTVSNSFFNYNSNSSEPTNTIVNSTKKPQPVLKTKTPKNITKPTINNTENKTTAVVSSNLNTSKLNNTPSSAKSTSKKAINGNSKTTQTVANASVKINSKSQKTNRLIAHPYKVSAKINQSKKENSNGIANNNLQKKDLKATLPSKTSYNKFSTINNTITTPSATLAKTNDTQNVKTKESSLDQNSLEKEKTNTIEEAIAENKERANKKDESKFNRWSVTPNAAPVYFNTLGEGSSIASQFNNNGKSGEVNMSYGINASYAINKKLIVRSGINRVNLGYNTNNVAVFDKANATTINSFSSIKGISGEETINNDATKSNIATSVSLVSEVSLNEAPETIASGSSANINQSLGFIEIPIEFQYIVLDKKLGLNVIGGFSSFFLNNNELFSETNNSRTLIGEAINVNKVSYSANFGLGFNYKMTEKFNLNFEPMFKYQINTFENTSGNFKPYFIGIYTGVGFKF